MTHRQELVQAAARREISRRPANAPVPLSFSQERTWFLQKLEPRSNAYHKLNLIRLEGVLDVDVLERAFDEILKRHEVLRTTFREIHGHPIQEVGHPPQSLIKQINLTELPNAKRLPLALSIVHQETGSTFNLTTDSLLRVRLFCLGPDHHILAMTCHRLIFDDGSTDILINELTTLYRAFWEGKNSPLPPLKIQYGDFAFWQRGDVAAQLQEEQLDYWHRQVARVPQLLELPTDRPRSSKRHHASRRLVRHISGTLKNTLESLAHESASTLFMAILAMFQAFLFRITAQTKFLVYSPVADRDRMDVQGLLGLFNNWVVLRGDVTGNLPLQNLLHQAKGTILDAYAHQGLPIERFVKVIQPEQGVGPSPPFQVVLQFLTSSKERFELPSLRLSPMEAPVQESEVELRLSLSESPDGLRCIWESRCDLFDSTTINRWAGQFETLLLASGESIGSLENGIGDLPLMSPAESHAVLVERNAVPEALVTAGEGIHHLVAARAMATPEAVALVMGADTITPRTLAQRATQIAGLLRDEGVGADVLVGVSLSRSLDMVAAVLGVLEAGGAYVPLDPSYPPARLEMMLEDAAPRVLLTETALSAKSPEGTLDFLDHPVKLRGFRIELEDIRSTLDRHASVQENVVVCLDSPYAEDKRIVSYVVPHDDALDALQNTIEETTQAVVSQWEEVWDDKYSARVEDKTFDLTGWLSSYTGEPIPAQEMEVWVDTTIDTIRSLNPKNVLEIGCGSGLLMSRLAPHCERYWGTDLSSEILSQVDTLIAESDWKHVKTLHRAADDFEGISTGQFDTIIINSVAQYFPNIEYFMRVVEQALVILKPGGHLFLGDLRHLSLHTAFHASVQESQMPAATPIEEFRRRVQQRQFGDKELLIDPRLFIAIQQQLPRASVASIRPHRGAAAAHNELTRFRYHAILQVEHAAAPAIVDWHDWTTSPFTVAQLGQHLQSESPAVFGLRNIPNSRLVYENALLDWMAQGTGTLGDFRLAYAAENAEHAALSPEELYALADTLSYTVELSWMQGDPRGRFDVLFKQAGIVGGFPPPSLTSMAWQDYANKTRQGALTQQLVPQLKQYLEAELPESMVPSDFVLINRLPLTPDGTINRAALPAPDAVGQSLARDYVAARKTGLGDVLSSSSSKLVCLDTLPFAAPEPQPATAILPGQLAYVIYTSGSTGRPKGVAVGHRSVVAFLRAMEQRPGLVADEVFVAVTTLSFDIAGLELYLPLLTGARLVVASDEETGDGNLLATRLAEARANAMQATPATWNLLLTTGSLHAGALPRVWSGGEALTRALADRLLATGAEVWNLYGPTETTIWSAVERVERGEGEATRAIALGSPIAGTTFYLLDRRGAPRPLGVPGELMIGGAGLARGYLARPALTAERFPPDPFAGEAGARLYRTGDLVRYRATGSLEFLGRIDHQVKVRGFRIELGEIEAALTRHPAVRGAVVGVRRRPASGDQLVAWIEPADALPSAETLRKFVGEHLPEYMVPAAFMVLEVFPRTPAGKIDRRALPDPEGGLAKLEARHKTTGDGVIAPRNEDEAILLVLFEEVLGLENLGVRSHFFQSGGNSLIANQLVARIREIFGVQVLQRLLFEHPTVAELAAKLHTFRRVDGLDRPPLPTESLQGPAPLSFPQERMWFFEQLNPGTNSNNLLFPVTLVGALDVAATGFALDEIRNRHQVLRASFAIDQGTVRQHFAGPRSGEHLPVVDLTALTDREGESTRIEKDFEARSFDLGQDPLMRSVLLRQDSDRHRLLLVLHHIVFDGWSVGILIREFVAIYRAKVQGQVPKLPEFSFQYSDFARWQRSWLRDEALAEQASYWQKHLGQNLQVAEIPTEFPRPQNKTSLIGQVRLFLPRKISTLLKATSRRQGVTLFMTFLAGLQTLIHRYTGADKITVGSLLAGRIHSGIEDLIGCFVSTLPLMTHLGGDPTFEETLNRARSTALGANDHQDIPFEHLIQAIQPARSASGHPFFQVLLSFQNIAFMEAELPDLTISPEIIKEGKREAEFDLIPVVFENQNRLGVLIAYNRDLFSATTSQRLLRHWCELLKSGAKEPMRRLSELSLLTSGERHQLLHEWSVPPSGPAAKSDWLERAGLDTVEPGTAVRVLDRSGRPLPIGVVGELVLQETQGPRKPGRPAYWTAQGRLAEPATQALEQHEDQQDENRKKAESLRAEVGEMRSKLSAKKRALLKARLSRKKPARAAAGREIPRRPANATIPLSFSQERMWFLQKLEPTSNAYHMLDLVNLEGDLVIDALERAFDEIVQRHEALRTAFMETNSAPIQVVLTPSQGLLKQTDLTALSADQRLPEVFAIAESEAGRAFDLTAGNLLRIRLFRLDADRYILALINHHLISDDWSTGILIHELLTLYQAFREGKASPLPPLKLQYGDFAVWQRGVAAARILEKQLDYWRRQVDGVPHLLELPTDHSRPAVRTNRGQRLVQSLPRTLKESLEGLARETGATLFMVLLAGFQTLLFRLTGQIKLLIGSPIANRNRVEVESLLGLFINSLVLRGDGTGNPAFKELLGRVRETTLGAYAHQDLPFERLVKDIQPERSLAHSPLFQVILQLQSSPKKALETPSLKLSPVEYLGSSSKVDLLLSITETSDGTLHFTWESSRDLFEAITILRWAKQFETLLQDAVQSPKRRLADLEWTSQAQRQQLILEWNDTATERPKPWDADTTLVTLFNAQARQCPETEAVVCGPDSLTYRTLMQRSTRLADHLRERGCGPETVVAICMERSVDLMVALWGVLQAGAAYLPLDVDTPPERLVFMLQDARPRTILTRGPRPAALAATEEDRETEVLALETLDLAQPATRDREPPDPRNLAYMIYTSGSTGRPKGAMISHRSIVNRIAWMQAAYPLAAGESVLQKTPVTFDVSVWELFWPFLTGARLVFAEPGGHRDSAYLVRIIEAQDIRVLHFVPSMLLAFLEEPNLELASGLRHVIASGEALTPELASRAEAGLQAAIHNLYGPTEAAVDVTAWPCRRGPRRTMPIGRPIENTSIHITERSLQPAPIGVAGELLIGGTNVGRGYFERPALTAETFIPDPFSSTPGQRLYRTGDLARTESDGVLEFLGRLDHQVKVRGFRIELGEIESVLAALPGVRDAAAAVSGTGNRKRIAAFVVPQNPEHRTETQRLDPELVSQLSAAMRSQLPDYMLPQLWIGLSEMPLNPSGKADRRALQALPLSQAEPSEAFVAPSTLEETALAEIWAEVLGVEKVGARDNFFTLGGDSILSIQVSTRARAAGLPVMPRLLFQHPTVAGLAQAIVDVEPVSAPDSGDSQPYTEAGLNSSELEAALARCAPPGQDGREAVEDLYELSPMQQGMLFHSLMTPDAEVFREQYVFTLEGDLDAERFTEAWSEVVARHPILRTSFLWNDEAKPLQAVHRQVEVPWQREDWRHLDEADQLTALEERLAEDRRRGFDLSKAPALRLALLQMADQRHTFVCHFHHILMDGWCLPVLFREIFLIYNSPRGGDRPSLPPVRPYREYIAWLRRQDSAVAEDYWRREMAAFEAPTALPLDTPTVERSPANLERRLGLSLPETDALEAFARRSQITLSTLIQGAWALLLNRCNSSSTVVFGVTVSGRPAELEGVESILGLFINTLPFRVDVDPQRALIPWLHELQNRHAEAREHQHLPLSRLQGWSPLPAGQALFESLVVFENFPVHASAEAMRQSLGVTGGRVFETTNLPLTLFSDPAETPGSGLSLSFAYDPARFTDQGIDQLLGHLRTLLLALADSTASSTVGSIPLLTATERHRLIHDHNDTTIDYRADDATLPQLIEQQSQRTPETVAVVRGQDHLSYGTLDARAQALADHLQARGAGPESTVAILLERSRQLMVALLGVLKAGAAYLPLDPGYPRERLKFMLEDAQPVAWITTQRLAGLLATEDDDRANHSNAEQPPQLLIEKLALNQPPVRSRTATPMTVRAQHLAYVIYTSGSTGRPKGAMLTHRGIVNRLLWKQATYSLTTADAILQKTPVSFDVSVWELFVPLMTGARLVLARPDGHRDNTYLAELMARERISVTHFVPSMLRPFLEAPGLESLRALRLVIASGEALPTDLAQRFAERLTARLDNLYGPTEASVDVTFWRSDPKTSLRGPSVPIGRPIANTSIQLLDAQREPAPVGFPGALMIGGVGLARGYLARPALTAERFVPNPFGSPGSRLYHTGDLARRLDGGAIEFLGRLDGQVKLRGQRIELGEIESALASHPDVSTAVVQILGDSPNERLVAYWRPDKPGHSEPKLHAEDLRAFLIATLPPAMIPVDYILLEELPLTPSGKIDRRALPAPMPPKSRREEPLNPVETVLLDLCEEVLGRPVDIQDNFFAIGGNSINAITLVGRLHRRLDVGITLAEMFAFTDLRDLGTLILQRQAQQENDQAIAAVLAELEELSEEEAHEILFARPITKAEASS